MDELIEADGLTEQYKGMCKYLSFLRAEFAKMAQTEKDKNAKLVIEYMQHTIDSYESTIANTVLGFLHKNVTYH